MSVSNLFAQFVVNSNGNSSIQCVGTPLSALSIGGVGSTNQKLFVGSDNIGVYSSREGTPTDSWMYSMVGLSYNVENKYNVGMRGIATSTSAVGGRAYGVMGTAGNSTTGFNFGLYGTLTGSQNGASIVGAVNSIAVYVDSGQYAGWFQGIVVVTGLVNGETVGDSDIRLKKNIAVLDGNTTLSNILKLKPVEYNLRQRPIDAVLVFFYV